MNLLSPMILSRPVLTLEELEAFDPHSPQKAPQRRFLCPLCGQGKPKDGAHRSLSVRVADGVWNCQRCKEKGQLREHWPQKDFTLHHDKAARTERTARSLRRAFDVDLSSWETPGAPPTSSETACDLATQAHPWKAIWTGASSLAGTTGEKYLARRALNIESAQRAGLRFHPSWNGRECIVFPFRDKAGKVVAVAGRAVRDGGLDKPALGPKSAGAFWAPCRHYRPLNRVLPWVIVCEAPLDALSLASCGFAALAVGGTSVPAWLVEELAFRRLALAFDRDDAGDEAAARCVKALAPRGALCRRLLPPEGHKDWNELLQCQGAHAVEETLLPFIFETP